MVSNMGVSINCSNNSSYRRYDLDYLSIKRLVMSNFTCKTCGTIHAEVSAANKTDDKPNERTYMDKDGNPVWERLTFSEAGYIVVDRTTGYDGQCAVFFGAIKREDEQS